MPLLSLREKRKLARGWLSGRASPSHGGGHWFESSTAHHFNKKQLRAAFLLPVRNAIGVTRVCNVKEFRLPYAASVPHTALVFLD